MALKPLALLLGSEDISSYKLYNHATFSLWVSKWRNG